MSTTAQTVFDLAIALMDEVDETSGETDTVDTQEYKNKTLLILNTLRGELFEFSDTYAASAGGSRPVAGYIGDFTSNIDLDDFLAQTIMPYGLAAHLLLFEDDTKAAFFQARYEELLNKYGGDKPSESETIENLYGGIEYGSNSY